jgi:V/A-type H+-transporting ATPase subunit I
MLRPEQMSKVSVTGSKAVMADVIETVHDLNLLHVTEYDDSWEGFEPGDPSTGAEEASEKLVTVRSIESILDVDDEDAGPRRIVTDEALEEELEAVRTEVNELDDRRNELQSELREIEDEYEAMQPFAELGIDLDLLSGYETLEVVVGEGQREPIRRALIDADDLSKFQIFPDGQDRGVFAIFAYPSDDADENALADALVGTEFATLSIPDAEGSPEEYLRELEHRKQQLEAEIDTVDNELENVKLDAAGFLLAAEEKLSIEVQKTEAPLSFATTENAFVAEGWIPTEEYSDFAEALQNVVGDRVEVEELERASFKASGDTHHEAAADGGTVMADDEPPVVQDNPGFVKPFEVLVEAVNRPTYRELDPTIFLFLTFPAFFGFMIGDLGYGLLYTALGYFLYSSFDRPAFKSMGGITIFAGAFTMLFGILFGEIFGLHVLGEVVWGGHPPIEKGLSPATVEWALGWLVVSVLVGIAHLNIGWIIDFVENLQLHDAKHAVMESGSWLLMMNGLWVLIFSDVVSGTAPEFLFTTFSAEGVLPLGFAGFPAVVGWIGFGAFVLGIIFLALAEPIEVVEFLNVLVNVLSYTRIAAVLLAKAGMAFTVNLLFFGVYVDSKGGWHFGLGGMPDADAVAALGPGETLSYHGYEVTEIMFGGLVHGDVATILLGLLVLVVGHALVLALGVTSAGLQAVRLEYVEFFNKFFEGGGRAYSPFGYERRYTTEE